MTTADEHLVQRMWVNGRAVQPDHAHLVVDGVAASEWRVVARLPGHSPFQLRYGLSVQLADGRIVHGATRLVDAEGELVVFEGTETLGGAWA